MANYDFNSGMPDFTSLLTSLKGRLGMYSPPEQTTSYAGPLKSEFQPLPSSPMPQYGIETQMPLDGSENLLNPSPTLPHESALSPDTGMGQDLSRGGLSPSPIDPLRPGGRLFPQATTMPTLPSMNGGPKPEPTFSDKLAQGFKDPLTQMLWSMGTSLMSAPPRRVPYGAGELIGNAGQSGMDAFNKAVTAQDKEKRQSTMDLLNAGLINAHTGYYNSQAYKNIVGGPEKTTDMPIGPELGKKLGLPPTTTYSQAGIVGKLDNTNKVSYQNVGTTKDGLSVSYDPKTAKQVVTMLDGTQQPYNKAMHGEVFSKTSGDVSKQLPPEAVEFEAQKYLQTGNLPATGMSGAGKIEIMTRAAQMAKEQGLSGKEATIKSALYKANSTALTNDTKQYDLMHKAELQAIAAGDLLKDSSSKYQRTNIRFVNSLEALAKNAVTDPGLADLQMKLLAFSREYYKVVTNSYASVQELSVGAQQQADKLLNTSDSWASLDAKINAAQQEMANTNRTFKQTMDERRQAMGETKPSTLVSGERVKVKTKDGKVGTIPAKDLNKAIGMGYTRVE